MLRLPNLRFPEPPLKVTDELVDSVADLAQLAISGSEVVTVRDRMARVLELVEQMDCVDTDGIEPLANPLEGSVGEGSAGEFRPAQQSVAMQSSLVFPSLTAIDAAAMSKHKPRQTGSLPVAAWQGRPSHREEDAVETRIFDYQSRWPHWTAPH